MTMINSNMMNKNCAKQIHALKSYALSAIAALIVSAPLTTFAAESAAPPAAIKASTNSASCNSVMSKTKEFRDSSHEQIEGICKTNQNSPAYWSCMNTRIDKGQGFADAGVRCNKITAKSTASR
jgi:hypothetical protein